MKNVTSTVVLLMTLVFAVSKSANAQTAQPSKIWVDINGGGQLQSHTLTTSSSSDLYGEKLVISTSQNIPAGGLFDISGGYKIRPAFGVAIGVSVYSRGGEGSLTASVPSPVVPNSPTIVNVSGSDLGRTETGTHIMFTYFVPMSDKVDFSIFAGPSFIHVSQDLISATVTTSGTTPVVTQTTTHESATAFGGNVGVTANYLLSHMIGVGGFLRYAGGSFDLSSASKQKAGGIQIGGGIRLRF